jgi:DNA-binding SARP family transcriptional activator
MEFDGKAWPYPSPPKLVSLLAYLILHSDRPQGRDQAAAALWPEVELGEARANLRRHIYLLRQALPPGEWLSTERETLQWTPQAGTWLDVEAFDARLDDALQPGADADQAFAECAALYLGDLLPEVYDDWLIPERERLLSRYLHLLKSASQGAEAQENFTDALRYARLLLSKDPLHEEAHRAVMRLLALSGDQPAALRQYEDCRDLLDRELNVEPMPATRDLYQRLLAGEPITPARQPARSSPAPAGETSKPAEPVPQDSAGGRGKRTAWYLAAGIPLLLLVGWFFFQSMQPKPAVLAISGAPAVQDTWITVDFPDDLYWPEDPYKTPHSQYSRAHLQYFDHLPKDRILVAVDLGQLPARASVDRAVFEIHLETWTEQEGQGALHQAYPAQVSIYQVTHAWQADQATFNQPWSQPGLGLGADTLTGPLDTQPLDGTAWLSFDVTPSVRAWLAKPEENHGWMMDISGAAQGMAHYWVDLTDQPAENLRPVLRITYRKP